MPSTAFISYSHRDEKGLELLHKHLAMLRRDGLLDVWYDRRIGAGQHIDDEVAGALEQCDLFIALVTADFLNSNYCYEREMQRALERVAEGTIRVVPVILEPCDWKSSPLAQFKALPKDGRPVSLWSNPNVAMLDVVTEIRATIAADNRAEPLSPEVAVRPPRIKVKRDFDAIDRAEFRDEAFETIKAFFQSSVLEISKIGDPLKARFEDMGAGSFTCTVVNRARRNGEAHITVHNQKSRSLGDIIYSFRAHASPDTANGIVIVEADEFQLYLKYMLAGFRSENDGKLTAEQVARQMWDDFVEQAGIEVD